MLAVCRTLWDALDAEWRAEPSAALQAMVGAARMRLAAPAAPPAPEVAQARGTAGAQVSRGLWGPADAAQHR
jgi:hypothetical protein